MSEMRIALVAEGPTDGIIIEAALRAFLPGPFLLTLLQPEATLPRMGTGWCGVLKWCREFARLRLMALEADPRLENFDIIVLHLDADVAEKVYADCGQSTEEMAVSELLSHLPCSRPCPPALGTVTQMQMLLCSWLGIAWVGGRTVMCIPSKSTEAWLATALFPNIPNGPNLLAEVECEMNMEGILANLPVGQRIRKSQREYRMRAGDVTRAWADHIKQHCLEARSFEQLVTAALP